MYPASTPVSRQSLAPKGSPQATAHLTQTMTLLGLSSDDLRKQIEDELNRNPALEVVEERRCPTCRRPLGQNKICPICSLPAGLVGEEPSVFVINHYENGMRDRYRDNEEVPLEETGKSRIDLYTHVLRQISPELSAEDRPIATHILSSLDENGLLNTPIYEIARYHHIPFSRVQAIIRQIQFADPIGVGSATPTDALLVQLEALAEVKEVPPLAAKAILEGMSYMGRRQYQELGRLLGVSAVEAREIASFISGNLNPFPGQIHWGDVRTGDEPRPSPYHRPDILISQVNGDPDGKLFVEILMPLSGILRLNPDFQAAIKEAPEERRGAWKEFWEKGNLLLKCLSQRNHTMVRLMKILVERQKDFIIHGNRRYSPMTRASLANLLEVHESTISRAVANKSIQLPAGRIIPLATFFDRSLHIRTVIKELVDSESKPYSDTELSKLLRDEGFVVARRTVAKYRAMENILAAHLRKKHA